jgi:hypothetical protein
MYVLCLHVTVDVIWWSSSRPFCVTCNDNIFRGEYMLGGIKLRQYTIDSDQAILSFALAAAGTQGTDQKDAQISHALSSATHAAYIALQYRCACHSTIYAQVLVNGRCTDQPIHSTRHGQVYPILIASPAKSSKASHKRIFLGTPDKELFTAACPKGPFRPARPNTVSSAPSPSPL